jgi:hypothetical protein
MNKYSDRYWIESNRWELPVAQPESGSLAINRLLYLVTTLAVSDYAFHKPKKPDHLLDQ